MFTITSEQLQATWGNLNVRYFKGRLSPIEIGWSARLTSSVGMFVSRVGPRHSETVPDRRSIRLSAPLLKTQSEQEVKGTLAHEMIHQWQYDVLKRRPNHGQDFLRKMSEMNRDGLGITIRHRLDGAVLALSKYVWSCTDCGRVYHRQRRTIRPRHHRCGRCLGPLREMRDRENTLKQARGKTLRAPFQQAVQLEFDLAIQ